MKKMVKSYKLLGGVVLFASIGIGLFYLQTRGMIPDFTMLQMYRMDIEAYLMQNLLLGVVIFSAIYVITVAVSLPFATPLTILAGFLFGTLLGTGIVAFSATIGATLALLLIRFFFQEYVLEKFGNRLSVVNNELHGHGFRDILLLRLTPIVPFALINVGAAVTHIKVRNFFFATLIGTLPFTFVYVNAGTRIASIHSPSDIISLPTIIGISLVVFAASLPLFISKRRGS